MQSGSPQTRNSHGRSRTAVFPLLLLAVILAVATVFSGCGSEITTYVDPDHGFSFDYDNAWDLIETPDSELPPDASESIGVFDPHGSDAGNELTFDYMSVDVYELDPAQVPAFEEMRDGFEYYLEQLEASDDSLWIIERPSTTVVDGMPALKVTYIYTANETEVRCSEYRIVDARGYVFSLYTQSSSQYWELNASIFDMFLNTFTLDANE